MREIILYDYLSIEGFYLTQEYGTNKYLDYRKYGLLWHEGEDYGDRNDPKPIVRSLHDGIVVRDVDTPKDNYGDYVVIWDDKQNCATWYCHLASNSVSIGQRVKAGDIIGIMGSTGNVTAKHLHLNLVLTDSNGVRLYKNKTQNLGFLDPHGKVFPPNVPQYKVTWLKPGENMQENEMMQISKSDFERIRGNSEKWDETVKYVDIQEDPASTPFEKVRSVIAGIKARTTDLQNQLSETKEKLSPLESEVSRLREELPKQASENKALISQLKTAIDDVVSQTKKTKNNEGYVYLIEGDGYHKVGKAINPGDRLSTLQVGSPYKLSLIRTWKVFDMTDGEYLVKQAFQEKLVRGEWYAIAKSDIDKIDSILEYLDPKNSKEKSFEQMSLVEKIDYLQGRIDLTATEKGELVKEIALLKSQIIVTENNYKRLVSEHIAKLSFIERIQVLLTGRLV